MAYDDGYYFGQCRIICQGYGNNDNGKTVKLINGNNTYTGVLDSNKRCEIVVPGRVRYKAVLGNNEYTTYVNAGYGECKVCHLANGHDPATESQAIAAVTAATNAANSASAAASSASTASSKASAAASSASSASTYASNASSSASGASASAAAAAKSATSAANSAASIGSAGTTAKGRTESNNIAFQFMVSNNQYGYKGASGSFVPFKTGAETFCYNLGSNVTRKTIAEINAALKTITNAITAANLSASNFVIVLTQSSYGQYYSGESHTAEGSVRARGKLQYNQPTISYNTSTGLTITAPSIRGDAWWTDDDGGDSECDHTLYPSYNVYMIK